MRTFVILHDAMVTTEEKTEHGQNPVRLHRSILNVSSRTALRSLPYPLMGIVDSQSDCWPAVGLGGGRLLGNGRRIARQTHLRADRIDMAWDGRTDGRKSGGAKGGRKTFYF